jgi:two-component system sensor histidine kinase KdpD
MLQEAQKLKASGVDLVIGYFEPHGRKETIAQTEGLETIPRRKVEYRGAIFEEMDTDAILRRKPQVCVVDEFAHSNVPGSARAKRWQEVRVIQDAGIDVLTTVNIQHLESLNDQVWHVTGIRVRETVPDWVVQEADEVVMVDTTPRALINRLERGVIYGPEKTRQALENFFTESNLTALRELALRQTAQQVEERREEPEKAVSATQQGKAERILLWMTPDPSTAMLIRRGKRVADFLSADCLAVYVQKDDGDTGLNADQKASIKKLLSFARDLHIAVTTLTGKDAGKAIGGFAREHAVTQIFVSRNSPGIENVINQAHNMEVTIVAERSR